MRQHYIKHLLLEAIFKAGSHTSSCPVLSIFPHSVGVAEYLAKRRLHLTVKPSLRHGDNISLVAQDKVVSEVTDVGEEPRHISRRHSQVRGKVPALSPRVGKAGYRGGGVRRISVCPARKRCSRRGAVLAVVVVVSWGIGGGLLKGLLRMRGYSLPHLSVRILLSSISCL